MLPDDQTRIVHFWQEHSSSDVVTFSGHPIMSGGTGHPWDP